jgi:hypothetical protein
LPICLFVFQGLSSTTRSSHFPRGSTCGSC